MNFRLLAPILSAVGTLVVAQTAPAPAVPSIKWRGALWASGAASDRETADGSLFLRSMDAGEGSFALDGLQLGGDVTLAEGWAVRFTLLAGQDAKVLNATNSQEQGSLAYPEAMLVWTGGDETVRIGRMATFMGMEFLDGTQDITASRGLLFTYAIPLNQVGVNWHHALNPSWSTDVWVFNGEDRVHDNNRGKTAGLGLNYNHGGAADKFVSLMAYSGAEQDGLGASAHTGAEGRKRERACMLGQWVWGASTLQWEAEYGREPFPAAAVKGATGSEDVKATWSGLGTIYKYQANDRWALFARAEVMKDDTGTRLNADPTVGAAYAMQKDADLKATSFTMGVERKWGSTFTRFEVRQDHLNKDVAEQDKHAFRDATSVTWSFGTNF